MLVDNDGSGDGETLSCPASDFLCREKRVEHLVADFVGYAAGRISDIDLCKTIVAPCADLDQTFFAGLADQVRNRVRGIHDEVKKDLIQVFDVTGEQWKISPIGFEVRDILVLVAGNDKGALQCAVQIGGCFFPGAGMRKLFHRLHDARYLLDAIKSSLKRLGNLLVDEFQIGVVFRLLCLLERLRRHGALTGALADGPVCT